MSKILVVCSSNLDRSVSIQRELQRCVPEHEIKSAGINSYFTNKNGTTHISDVDLASIDFFIFCENIHRDITYKSYFRIIEYKPCIILNLGHFEKHEMNKYVERAMEVLSFFKKIEVRKHWEGLVFKSINNESGLMLFLDLQLNEMVATDFVIKIGDTLDYKHHKYDVTQIESNKLEFGGKKNSIIGLKVKKTIG